MCIRDSLGRWSPGHAGPGAAGRAAAGGERQRRADQRARGPVSYTHLRAHETVLDLVCRLLLEK